MKLHKSLFSIILFSFLLVGCTGKIDETQWSAIQGDMSIDMVEDSLGKPKETYTEKQEMIDEINRKVNFAKNLNNNPILSSVEPSNPHEQIIEDMELIRSAVERDANVKIMQYELEYEDGGTTTRNVYLENDRVVYYDGARR